VTSAPPSVQLWERLSHSHPRVEAYPVTAARSPDRVQSRFHGVSGKSASPPTPEVLAASQYRRSGPILLQKSPQRFCEIRIGNNRIDVGEYLNQCCESASQLESILRGRMGKMFLQQYRPRRDILDHCTDQFWPVSADFPLPPKQLRRGRLQRLPYADAISKVGSCFTLNDIERAMKHFSAAASCRRRAMF
jgi:hypothetical protein